MPKSPLIIFAAVLLLTTTRAIAQQKIITTNPYETQKLQQVQKYKPDHKGHVIYDMPKEANAHPLAIPAEMTNYTEFQNNLLITKTNLEANAINFNKCKILASEVNPAITDAAILHLYLNDTYPALLLAANAALVEPAKSADLPRLINNLGSILIESGQADVAIPYLLYANKMSPHNPSILNNLGQAYVHKERYGTAKSYFTQVLAILPNHPLVNLTLANIDRLVSTNANVLLHAENSLKGGFTAHAWQFVQDNDKNARLQDLIADRITKVEYIKGDVPPIPDNCVSVEKDLELWQQRVKFDQAAGKQAKYYDDIENKDALITAPTKKDIDKMMIQAEKMKAEGMKMMHSELPDVNKLKAMNAGMEGMVNYSIGAYDIPFSFFAKLMVNSLRQDRNRDLTNKDEVRFNTIFQIKTRLETEHKEAVAKILASKDYPDQKSKCQAIDDQSNRLLKSYNTELQTWRQKRWAWDKEYFNQMLFWLYIDSKDTKEFTGQFAGLMSEFWTEMETMTSANAYFEPCAYFPGQDKEPAVPEPNLDILQQDEISCPFKDLEVKTGSANYMIMNCQLKVNIQAAATALSSTCTPTTKQSGVLALTFMLGLDAELTNFLLVEDGRIMDNTIKWDRTMEWNGETKNWWLNSGISYITPKPAK